MSGACGIGTRFLIGSIGWVYERTGSSHELDLAYRLPCQSKKPQTPPTVCGIETAPRKVTRSMNKKTIKRKTKVKPFIKAINFTHILPTR